MINKARKVVCEDIEGKAYEVAKGNFVHSIHMYYECNIIGGEISTEFFGEHEKQYASEAEWVDLSRIDKIEIYSSSDTKKVLRNYV